MCQVGSSCLANLPRRTAVSTQLELEEASLPGWPSIERSLQLYTSFVHSRGVLHTIENTLMAAIAETIVLLESCPLFRFFIIRSSSVVISPSFSAGAAILWLFPGGSSRESRGEVPCPPLHHVLLPGGRHYSSQRTTTGQLWHSSRSVIITGGSGDILNRVGLFLSRYSHQEAQNCPPCSR